MLIPASVEPDYFLDPIIVPACADYVHVTGRGKDHFERSSARELIAALYRYL
jgi:hypothetical protein